MEETKTAKQYKNPSSERLDHLLQQYFRLLGQLNIETIERGTPLQHAKWMCLIAESVEDVGKKNRWIGFIHGVLFMSNIFSIEEMRTHITEGNVNHANL